MSQGRAFSVKVGSATVRVYPTPAHGKESWTVAYYLDGKRKTARKGSRAKAREAAQEFATRLANLDAASMSLDPATVALFSRSAEALQGLNVSLDTALTEYAEAVTSLGGVPLREAVSFYVRHHPGDIERITVAECADAMVASKAKLGLSRPHVEDLRKRLNTFSDAFTCDLIDVRGDLVSEWLHSMRLSSRSKNNYLSAVRNLVSWAKDNRLLPSDWNELASVKTFKTVRSEAPVFTPDEMRRLIDADDGRLTAYLGIASFAGLRQSEIARLQWSDISLDRGVIRLATHRTKTGSRRVVPVQPNLLAILERVDKRKSIVPFKNMTNAFKRLGKRAGVEWRRNACRDSFISYRLAIVKDAAKVALESGNSPKMIFEHYLELVDPKDAAEWFAIGL